MEENETEDARLPFSFTGQVSTPLTLDPAEFKGRGLEHITKEIMALLSGMGAGASYFEDEVELAAQVILDANGES